LVKNGSADKAGIQVRNIDQFLQVHCGNIITALDHYPFKDDGEYISYIENHKSVGQKIVISVDRAGHTIDLTAILGERTLSSATSTGERTLSSATSTFIISFLYYRVNIMERPPSSTNLAFDSAVSSSHIQDYGN
jgi:hypothetical protein